MDYCSSFSLSRQIYSVFVINSKTVTQKGKKREKDKDIFEHLGKINTKVLVCFKAAGAGVKNLKLFM